MVHRAIVGSIERAVAQLIEVHGGAFPAWLAPVQLVVLPISDDEEKPHVEVARRASAAACGPRSRTPTKAVSVPVSARPASCRTRPSSADARPPPAS